MPQLANTGDCDCLLRLKDTKCCSWCRERGRIGPAPSSRAPRGNGSQLGCVFVRCADVLVVPVCMVIVTMLVRLVWSLSGFLWNSARAGEALGHLVLRFYAFVASCFASMSGAVPGTGGATGSFGVPVPTASPQNNGAAHGPRHPAYTASILPNQLFWLCRVFVGFLVSLRFLFGIHGRKTQLVCILALQVPVPVRGFV